jgi:hypothetical protein
MKLESLPMLWLAIATLMPASMPAAVSPAASGSCRCTKRYSRTSARSTRRLSTALLPDAPARPARDDAARVRR